jgi:opacity protein-like surface antigen
VGVSGKAATAPAAACDDGIVVHRAERRVALGVGLAVASLSMASQGFAEIREDRDSRHVSFTTGASFGDGDTALALSAAMGIRFSSRVGLELEAAYARKLDFTADLCPPPRVCVIGGRLPVTGRTVALVPQLTVDLLPAHLRVRAYLQAGAGAGHVRQRYWVPRPDPDAVEFTRSNLTAALAYGGGVDARVSRRLAVGADVRWLQMLDDEPGDDPFITPAGTLSTIRVGARVRWRF